MRHLCWIIQERWWVIVAKVQERSVVCHAYHGDCWCWFRIAIWRFFWTVSTSHWNSVARVVLVKTWCGWRLNTWRRYYHGHSASDSVHLPQVIIFCHHPSFTNFLIYGSKPTCSTNPSNHRLSSSSWLLHGLVLHQKPSFIKHLVLLIAFMPLLPDNVGKEIVCRLSCWNIRSFFQSDIVITISHEWLEQFWWNWQWILISPCWWPD